MVDPDTQQPPPMTRRASDNGWVGKADALVDIVNRLGLATFIVLVLLGGAVAVFLGKVANPFVSAAVFQEHRDNTNMHHVEQIKVLKGMYLELRMNRCQHEGDEKEVSKCLRTVQDETVTQAVTKEEKP